MQIIESDLILNYVKRVPLALALERLVESSLFTSSPKLEHPILDVGCGDGIFASLTFDFLIDYGLDLNQKELKKAAGIGAYKKLLLGSASRIPLQSNSMSAVFSNSALEHIKDLDVVFREVYRVLKPGGKFIFTVPSELFDRYSNLSLFLSRLGLVRIETYYRKIYNKFWRHHHFMSASSWEKWINEHGFVAATVLCYNSKFHCRLNDALVLFGGLAKLNKIIFNTWTFLPKLRLIYFKLILKFLKNHLNTPIIDPKGGLVYVSAIEPKN